MSKIQELPKIWNLKTPELQPEITSGSSSRYFRVFDVEDNS